MKIPCLCSILLLAVLSYNNDVAGSDGIDNFDALDDKSSDWPFMLKISE
ncbi:MAG: hypothetical protein K8S62_06810 [Candidatus Sabulitectum sp.]|nr:hypothetical protein [Candidatus Sabulitectum sp.]